MVLARVLFLECCLSFLTSARVQSRRTTRFLLAIGDHDEATLHFDVKVRHRADITAKQPAQVLAHPVLGTEGTKLLALGLTLRRTLQLRG